MGNTPPPWPTPLSPPPPTSPTLRAWPVLAPCGGSPFRKNSHSSCAEDVERRLFVFCPWYMLCSKVQEWRNVITDFLWRGSKFWNAYRKESTSVNKQIINMLCFFNGAYLREILALHHTPLVFPYPSSNNLHSLSSLRGGGTKCSVLPSLLSLQETETWLCNYYVPDTGIDSTWAHEPALQNMFPRCSGKLTHSFGCHHHLSSPNLTSSHQIMFPTSRSACGNCTLDMARHWPLQTPNSTHTHNKPESNFHYKSAPTACYLPQWPPSLASQQPKPGFWINPSPSPKYVFWVSLITSPWFLSHYFISPHLFWQPDPTQALLQSSWSLDHSLCKEYLPDFKF